MALNLEELIELMIINDPKAIEFKRRVVSSFKDADAMNSALIQHCDNQKQTHCYDCEDEGECLILSGIAYLDLHKIDEAISAIEDANLHFRGRDDTWNSIIGLDLLGIAYEMGGKRHTALIEYQQAQQQLKIYSRIHAHDYSGKSLPLENELKDRLENPIPVSPSIPAPLPFTTPDPDTAQENAANSEGYLSIPWIPIYEDVQAGANGLIWIDPPKREKTELHQVFLQGNQCSIHPIHKGDHRIVITSERQYAWAKVRGHSMEEATLTPICENDYVLFYRANSADNDSIVVVAQHGSGADDSCMVKRIDLDNKLLFSQTNRKGAEYEPIPFHPDRHQIVGVVVAVAKPQDGKMLIPTQE